MHVDRFYDRELGWHFHIYIPGVAVLPSGVQLSAFGVWWAKRCDFDARVSRPQRSPASPLVGVHPTVRRVGRYGTCVASRGVSADRQAARQP